MREFRPIDENTSDEVLLAKLKKTNRKAFILVYERYHKILYAVSYQYLRDGGRAQDVVQDVFTKLWEERGSIEVRTNLKSYLYSMVRNHILNIIKRENRQVISDYDIERETLADTDNLLETLAERELTDTLYRAIDSLPKQKRSVCLLKMQDGMSNREIAEKLDISENTVKKHYSKSLVMLRSILKKMLNCFVFVTLTGF